MATVPFSANEWAEVIGYNTEGLGLISRGVRGTINQKAFAIGNKKVNNEFFFTCGRFPSDINPY